MRVLIPKHIRRALVTVLGVVLVWRGIWLVLDWIDIAFFGGNHAITGILGIMAGVAILYYPDHRLDELQKL